MTETGSPGTDSADAVEIRLADGERVTVTGDFGDVEKRLSDAARSGPSRLAWLRRVDDGGTVAVNPAHVVALLPPPT